MMNRSPVETRKKLISGLKALNAAWLLFSAKLHVPHRLLQRFFGQIV